MSQTIIDISVRHSWVKIAVGHAGESSWQMSSITLERDGYIREGVWGEGIDILSNDSMGILRGILASWSPPRPTYYDYRITEWMLSDSGSPLVQSILVLCDSIRESAVDSRIIEILDSIQSARLQSV